MNGPNSLSLARILLTIPAVWAIVGGRGFLATAFVCLALLTDFLDGWLARRRHASTELGRVLDPVADKILVAGVLGALVHVGRVPLELAAVVVFRDAVMLALAWIRIRGGGSVPPADIPGKIAFGALGVWLAGELAGVHWPGWSPAAVGALYFVAGLSYFRRIPGLPLARILKGER